jgi:hypothetical protein
MVFINNTNPKTDDYTKIQQVGGKCHLCGIYWQRTYFKLRQIYIQIKN